jgi:hypothetical protein
MAQHTTVNSLARLEKEYAIKDTDELPIRALVALATYCANKKNVDATLRKVADIVAYLLITEASAKHRDIDLDATLAGFNDLVKETLLGLRMGDEKSPFLH